MQDIQIIQIYINNFRRRLAIYLKPGIGLSCKIYPVVQEGAVLEFMIDKNISNEDHFKPVSEKVNEVLKIIPQKMVGGNIDGFRFSGTNISMESNRIILIKGEDNLNQWNDDSARKDVQHIVNSQSGVIR